MESMRSRLEEEVLAREAIQQEMNSLMWLEGRGNNTAKQRERSDSVC